MLALKGLLIFISPAIVLVPAAGLYRLISKKSAKAIPDETNRVGTSIMLLIVGVILLGILGAAVPGVLFAVFLFSYVGAPILLIGFNAMLAWKFYGSTFPAKERQYWIAGHIASIAVILLLCMLNGGFLLSFKM